MLEGQVTFTITLKMACPQDDWQYTINEARLMFYNNDEKVKEKINNTNTMTLKSATSNYLIIYVQKALPLSYSVSR